MTCELFGNLNTNKIFVEIIYFGSHEKDNKIILRFENLELHIELCTDGVV